MNLLIYLLLALLAIVYQSHSFGQSVHSERLLNYIMTSLPKYGILRRDERGLIYVKIDNNYIHKLIAYIQDEEFEVPPYFGEGLHGAHITVISPEEVIYYALGEIIECGQVICFQPKTCRIVHPPTWASGEKAFLITIEAHELEKLREKYQLPKNKYDFHITIGIKGHAMSKII